MAQGLRTKQYVKQALASAPPSATAPVAPRNPPRRVAMERSIKNAHAQVLGTKDEPK